MAKHPNKKKARKIFSETVGEKLNLKKKKFKGKSKIVFWTF
tara:strand:- start:695 stop:817 length:123 start_codon:yes stop_codon:yes gene_type:complete